MALPVLPKWLNLLGGLDDITEEHDEKYGLGNMTILNELKRADADADDMVYRNKVERFVHFGMECAIIPMAMLEYLNEMGIFTHMYIVYVNDDSMFSEFTNDTAHTKYGTVSEMLGIDSDRLYVGRYALDTEYGDMKRNRWHIGFIDYSYVVYDDDGYPKDKLKQLAIKIKGIELCNSLK